MKGKRTDAETRAQVIEYKINNPDLSTRDIGEIMWMEFSTVARILVKDLPHVATHSDRIVELIQRNNRLLSMADSKLIAMMESWENMIRASELVSLRESAFKQNLIIQQTNWEETKNAEIVITI